MTLVRGFTFYKDRKIQPLGSSQSKVDSLQLLTVPLTVISTNCRIALCEPEELARVINLEQSHAQ